MTALIVIVGISLVLLGIISCVKDKTALSRVLPNQMILGILISLGISLYQVFQYLTLTTQVMQVNASLRYKVILGLFLILCAYLLFTFTTFLFQLTFGKKKKRKSSREKRTMPNPRYRPRLRKKKDGGKSE